MVNRLLYGQKIMEWGRVRSFSSLQRGTCEGRTWHVLMRERDSPSLIPGVFLCLIPRDSRGEGKPCAAKGVDLTVIPPELVSILKACYPGCSVEKSNIQGSQPLETWKTCNVCFVLPSGNESFEVPSSP